VSAGVLFLLQRDEPWTGLVWLVLFIVFPLVARLLRALLARVGVVQPEQEEAELTQQQRAERRRILREERRRAEREGEDLWRQLARGEAVAPPPRELPLEEPAVRTASAEVAREVSLELEAPRDPLSVLGGVHEPSEAPETSLETSVAPSPLLAFGSSPLTDSAPSTATPDRRAFAIVKGELRRAVLLAEILGPPVSDRPMRL
jgi:hypothetical protein